MTWIIIIDENCFCVCAVIPERLVRYTGLCVFHVVTLMSAFYNCSHSFYGFQAVSCNFSQPYVLRTPTTKYCF